MSESLRQKTKRGLYWKFAEQFSNYGIQFVIGIILARLLSPEDYGLTALPAVFISVAGIFVSAGFHLALVRKPELTEKDLSTAFYYSGVVGFVMYCILFLSSPWIAEFYNAPVLEDILRVTSLGFLYNPLSTPQGVLLLRKMDFKTPTKISVISRLLTGVVGITLAYIGYGVWALVLSYLVGDIFSVICKWFVVRWVPKTGWSKESFRYLWGFGNKLMLSNLIDTLYNNITPVFIGKFYSPADLGIYNRAVQYANIPSAQLTGTIASVSFPALSAIQEDEEKLIRAYRTMLRVSAFIIFPIMMLMAALSRPLIITMISSKWESSIIYLQILCFSLMWYPINGLNLNLLQVKGRSDLFLRLEVIKKILGIFVLAVTLPMGIIYFCVASVFSSILCLFINTYYTGALFKLPLSLQFRDFGPSLLLSVTMAAIVYGVTLCISSLFLQLLGGCVIGVSFYCGISYLKKMPEVVEIQYLLKRKSAL